MDESNRLMTESMESLPESAKETFAQTADSLKETLAKSKEAFNKAVERYGDDNAEVPKKSFVKPLLNS